MSMTLNEMVESVCISLDDFLQKTRERVKILIPQSVVFVVNTHQWECTIRPISLTASTSHDWIDLPDSFGKEYALRRSGYTKPIEYITPDQYNERLAGSSTPYGAEAIKYTIMGGESLRQKRIHFLDPPTSALVINMLYNVKIDPLAVQDLPDEFLPVVKTHVIYQATPPMIYVNGIRQFNPSFITARNDYRTNLSRLVSYNEGQRGRNIPQVLDDVARRASQHMHR